MTDRELYVLSIPEDSQQQSRTENKRKTATHGVLDDDLGAVEPISTAPGTQRLRGQYRGRYAELMATELRELSRASAIPEVSFSGREASTPDDGYYAVESMAVERLDPRTDGIYRFDGTLTKVGTRESHRRAVRTEPVQVDNEFGNDLTAPVGVPAAAANIRWVDRESGAREAPTAATSRSAEFGDVDVYDTENASFAEPTLVYDLPYGEDGRTDVKLWDDHGRSKLDADGLNGWQRAFVTGHEFAGTARVDNGLLRLAFDTDANALSAERWDDAAGAWSSVALGASDWELADAGVDFTRVGDDRVEAQVAFRDPAQSPTARYRLDVSVQRGLDAALRTRPVNATGGVPSGLRDLLAPTASSQQYDAGPSKGLVARREVRE